MSITKEPHRVGYSFFLHQCYPRYHEYRHTSDRFINDSIKEKIIDFNQILLKPPVDPLEISGPAMKNVPLHVLQNYPYDDSKKKYIISAHSNILTHVIPYIGDEFLRKKLYLYVLKSQAKNVNHVNGIIQLYRKEAKKLGFKSCIEACAIHQNTSQRTLDDLLSTWDTSLWEKANEYQKNYAQRYKVDRNKPWNIGYLNALYEKNVNPYVFSRTKVMDDIQKMLLDYGLNLKVHSDVHKLSKNEKTQGFCYFHRGSHSWIEFVDGEPHYHMGLRDCDEQLSLCAVYELWRAYYSIVSFCLQDDSLQMFNPLLLEDNILNGYRVDEIEVTPLSEWKEYAFMDYYNRERLHVRDVLTQYYAKGPSGKIEDAYKKAFEKTKHDEEDIAYDVLAQYDALWTYPYFNV